MYLQNLTVTVDIDNRTNSESRCYTYIDTPAVIPGVELVLNCTWPIRGRYVTVRRLGGYRSSSLELCDVQVFGKFVGKRSVAIFLEVASVVYSRKLLGFCSVYFPYALFSREGPLLSVQVVCLYED